MDRRNANHCSILLSISKRSDGLGMPTTGVSRLEEKVPSKSVQNHAESQNVAAACISNSGKYPVPVMSIDLVSGAYATRRSGGTVVKH